VGRAVQARSQAAYGRRIARWFHRFRASVEESRQVGYQAKVNGGPYSRDEGRALIATPRYLVDSSVISKVFLLDESHVEETRKLFEAFYSGRIVLLTPPIAYLEVANAIVKAARTNRLSEPAGRQAIEDLFDLAIEIAGDEEQLELAIREAYPVAESLQRSIYDAIFLVTSRAIEAPFITADKPTYEAARSQFDVIWLPQLELP
jgi:predicted nucleic acid-binding protein